MLGSDMERVRYRQAVNGSHRLVRSGADSPVRYNAFDRDLQLWVAACLYYGAVDVVEKMRGPMTDAQADAFYALRGAVRHDIAGHPGHVAGRPCGVRRYWHGMAR